MLRGEVIESRAFNGCLDSQRQSESKTANTAAFGLLVLIRVVENTSVIFD